MADDRPLSDDAPEADGEQGAPAARRPRRTASRAAGPPQPVFSASAQPAPPAPEPAAAVEDDEPEEDAPEGDPGEAVGATGEASPSTPDGDEPEAAGAQRPPATALLFQPPSTEPRRRRGASRPAGAPAPVAPAASEPVEAPATDPGPPAQREPQDDEVAPPARRSRARSRRASAPAGEAATAPETADAQEAAGRSPAKDASAPSDPAPTAAPDPAQGDDAPAQPRTRAPRRRRAAEPAPAPAAEAPGASRRLQPGALAPSGDGVSSSSSDGPAEQPDDAGGPPAEDQPAEETPVARGGSRSAVDLADELDRLRGRSPAQPSSRAATLDAIELPDADGGDAEGDDADGDDGAPRSRRRRGGRGRRRRSGGEGESSEGGEDAGQPSGADEDGTDDTATPATSQGPDEGEGDGDDAQGEGDGRRRRRRGRRGSAASDEQGGDRAGADGSGDGSDTAGGADTGADSSSDDETDGDDEAETGSSGSGRRRRRGRSRSGSSGSSGSGSSGSGDGDVTAIKGSTRLEAKRQRRREGRESGRRPKIVSEAEFLARRESVERTMVVRSDSGRTQVAVLEDGVLVEHYVARKQHTSMIGDVHLGKVQNVLPSMEAAFVDIGRGRNAVLYAGEVNWEAAGLTGQAKRIETALGSGDSVLVQVSKDPVGHKGARLTSQVSLPGRYLVYVPGGSMTGISRKLPDTERARLKKILKEVVPADGGVIVRTAAEGASETELERDVERLVGEWERISARAKKVSAPTLLHGEPDLTIKVVRDVFNEDFAHLVVDGEEAWAEIKPYVDAIAPDLSDRVERWEGPDVSAFASYRVDEQIAKALERKVWLPSGGSLVIDRTEAMTVVDVNTGRFTGSGGNLEETVTRNNLEAAEEIVRQLRLRDVGGIVVVDFIDMVLESNRDLVLRRLVECLGRDRTKHQVAEVTSLGLVQMTRKRVGQGLLEAFSAPCETCHGSGVVLHDEPLEPSSGGNASSGNGNGSGSGSRGGRGRRGQEEAPEAVDEAERSRLEAARDAVRDAIHGVALASRLVAPSAEDAAPAAAPAVGSDRASGPDDGQPEEAGQPAEPEQLEVVERVETVVVEEVVVESVADADAAGPATTGDDGRDESS